MCVGIRLLRELLRIASCFGHISVWNVVFDRNLGHVAFRDVIWPLSP